MTWTRFDVNGHTAACQRYQIMEIPRCDYNISIQHMYRTLEYMPRCKDHKVI